MTATVHRSSLHFGLARSAALAGLACAPCACDDFDPPQTASATQADAAQDGRAAEDAVAPEVEAEEEDAGGTERARE